MGDSSENLTDIELIKERRREYVTNIIAPDPNRLCSEQRSEAIQKEGKH